MRTLQFEHNATFRVDTATSRHVLRINRAGLRDEAAIRSEAAWLAALRRDTDLVVPEPEATVDGRLVVTVEAPDVPGPRTCVLLRWIDGRFVDRRLTPAHLARMGSTMAELQAHAAGWTPPGDFVRERLDGLTAEARRASAAPLGTPAPSPIPGLEDGDRAVGLVRELVSASDAAVAARTIAWAREATATLSGLPGGAGLIHGDLHQENTLFTGDVAAAIDFDDCGWGFHLYDAAVPLSELTERPRYRALRDAFLEAYARRQSLPAGADELIDAFIAYRGLQLVVWVLESREHAAFRDRWQAWAGEDLAWLAGRVDGRRTSSRE